MVCHYLDAMKLNTLPSLLLLLITAPITKALCYWIWQIYKARWHHHEIHCFAVCGGHLHCFCRLLLDSPFIGHQCILDSGQASSLCWFYFYTNYLAVVFVELLLDSPFIWHQCILDSGQASSHCWFYFYTNYLAFNHCSFHSSLVYMFNRFLTCKHSVENGNKQGPQWNSVSDGCWARSTEHC